MNKYELEALDNLINYNYEQEHKDFEANGKPKNHIFRDIEILSAYYDKQV